MTVLFLALTAVILPWAVVLVPGLLFFNDSLPLLQNASRVFLGGLALSTLFFSAAITLRAPLLLALILWLVVTVLIGIRLCGQQLRRQKYVYAGLLAFLFLVYGAFSIPFLSYHQGLPTGDAQKAVYWAQLIISNQRWPAYINSLAQLNRDPVDFYTPGLHALTAGLLVATPNQLFIIGFFSIVAATVVALEAAALASLFLKDLSPWWAGATFILVFSHERFLRYVREPGYHLQNVVGEVFLWGVVLLALSLMQRWRWRDALLGLLAGAALVLSHQFSSFVAVFIVVAMGVAFAVSSPALLRHVWVRYRRYAVAAIASIVVILVGGLFSSLASKLPDLFTRSPHLLDLLPSPAVYLNLANPLYLYAGIAGWIAVMLHHYRHKLSTALAVSFAAGGVAVLILSIGPLLGVDIPPVRALFYSVVPLSVGVVFLLAFSITALHRFSRLITLLVVAGFCYAGIAQAFTLSHSVRTNATLLPGQQFLITQLSGMSGGILVDEYSRASTSWLLLTHRPVFTRIAADLHQQMDEAGQSVVRKTLYQNQLDFEKIYNVGSLPLVTELMAKHGITNIVGIDGATNWSLMHNPALQPIVSADDATVYVPKKAAQPTHLEAHSTWLLEPTTLLQDIGSSEDVFEHIPASVAATRLSDPRLFGQTTYRETTSPFIRLRFNIGDFVRLLWDTNHDGHPDSTVQFVLKLLDHPSQLQLATSTGLVMPIKADTSVIHLSSNDILIEDDGFITFTLRNSTQQPVQLDFMALGLCQNSPC